MNQLAVTDACIFIDLIELHLSSAFFGLPLEIHTSLDVYNELSTEQKEILNLFHSSGNLSLHNLSSEERILLTHVAFAYFPVELITSFNEFTADNRIIYFRQVFLNLEEVEKTISAPPGI